MLLPKIVDDNQQFKFKNRVSIILIKIILFTKYCQFNKFLEIF